MPFGEETDRGPHNSSWNLLAVGPGVRAVKTSLFVVSVDDIYSSVEDSSV